MARQDISTIKGYFETGDVPTAEQFGNLIDSSYNSTSGIETINWFFYKVPMFGWVVSVFLQTWFEAIDK